MTIDWLRASIEQRKILYRQMKRAADEKNIDIEKLAFRITGERSRGEYIKTLRSGKYSKKSALQFYNWLAANEPNLQQALAEDLMSDPLGLPGSQWSQLLDKRATSYGFEIVPRGFEIVGFSRGQPTQQIRVNEDFCLKLSNPRAGFAVALQFYDGSWYPLPIHPENMMLPIPAATLLLPTNPATGKVEFLSEPH